jgi:hypothetical protein
MAITLAGMTAKQPPPLLVGPAHINTRFDANMVGADTPLLRYTAGPRAGRVSTLHRVVPARTFDKRIRKLGRLVG